MGLGLYSCTGCNSYCATAKSGVLLSVPAGVMRRDCAAVRSRGKLEEIPKSILRRNMYLGRVVERRRFET